jgi:signal peptidase I
MNPIMDKAQMSKAQVDENVRKDEGGLWETVKVILQALLIAVVVRTLLFQPFNIPSGSLVPTLLIGDYLFVSKTAYGYSKYSFPWGLAPFEGRVWEGSPKRGDVVVFRPPGEPETDFIKRVIGLPGDRIQVKAGRLYINDQEVERKQIADFPYTEGSNTIPVTQYLETLPGGVTHPVIETAGDNGPYDNTPVYVVPADHYFMMGDNRDNSNDSRPWNGPIDQVITDQAMLQKVGFVPSANLIGPAKILFWSYDDSFKGANPITWVTALRWRRLLNLID